MDEDDVLPESLAFAESLCQLADAINGTSNKQVRERLLTAMDMVLQRFGPVNYRGFGSSVIDVTGSN